VVSTDFFGTAPMIFETERQTQFLIPMIVAYVAGLGASLFVVMLLFPAMLVAINDMRRFFHWLGTGHWPSREVVEPASAYYPLAMHDGTPGLTTPESTAQEGTSP